MPRVLFVTISLALGHVTLSLALGHVSVEVGSCPDSAVPTNLRVFAFSDFFFNSGPPASGFLAELLEVLTKQAGLTYTLNSKPDGVTAIGNKNQDGSWNGSLIGSLINNQADLALADFTPNSEREAVVDFLVPFGSYDLQVLVNPQFGLNSDVKFVIEDNADLAFVKNSKDPMIQSMYKIIQADLPDSIVATDELGLAKVLSGNYAYIGSSQALNQLVSRNVGRAVKTNDLLGTFYLSLAVQQGSPLRRILNRGLLQLEEDGTVQSLLNKYGLAN